MPNINQTLRTKNGNRSHARLDSAVRRKTEMPRRGTLSEEYRHKEILEAKKGREAINFGITPRRRDANPYNDEFTQYSPAIVGENPVIATAGSHPQPAKTKKGQRKALRRLTKGTTGGTSAPEREEHSEDQRTNSYRGGGAIGAALGLGVFASLAKPATGNPLRESPENNAEEPNLENGHTYETEIDKISAQFQDGYNGKRINIQLHLLGKDKEFMEECLSRSTLSQVNLSANYKDGDKYKPRIQIICSDQSAAVLSNAINEFLSGGDDKAGKWAYSFLEKGGQFVSHSRMKNQAEAAIRAQYKENNLNEKELEGVFDKYFEGITNMEVERDMLQYASDHAKLPGLLMNNPGDINLKMEADALVLSKPNENVIKQLEEGKFVATDFWDQGVPIKHGQNPISNGINARMRLAFGHKHAENVRRNEPTHGGFIDTGISATKSGNMQVFGAMLKQHELENHLRESFITVYNTVDDAENKRNGVPHNAYDFFFKTPKSITQYSNLFLRGDEVNTLYASISPELETSRLYADRSLRDGTIYYASAILQAPNKPGAYIWLSDYADINITSASIKDMGVPFIEVKTCKPGPDDNRNYGCWSIEKNRIKSFLCPELPVADPKIVQDLDDTKGKNMDAFNKFSNELSRRIALIINGDISGGLSPMGKPFSIKEFNELARDITKLNRADKPQDWLKNAIIKQRELLIRYRDFVPEEQPPIRLLEKEISKRIEPSGGLWGANNGFDVVSANNQTIFSSMPRQLSTLLENARKEAPLKEGPVEMQLVVTGANKEFCENAAHRIMLDHLRLERNGELRPDTKIKIIADEDSAAIMRSDNFILREALQEKGIEIATVSEMAPQLRENMVKYNPDMNPQYAIDLADAAVRFGNNLAEAKVNPAQVSNTLRMIAANSAKPGTAVVKHEVDGEVFATPTQQFASKLQNSSFGILAEESYWPSDSLKQNRTPDYGEMGVSVNRKSLEAITRIGYLAINAERVKIPYYDLERLLNKGEQSRLGRMSIMDLLLLPHKRERQFAIRGSDIIDFFKAYVPGGRGNEIAGAFKGGDFYRGSDLTGHVATLIWHSDKNITENAFPSALSDFGVMSLAVEDPRFVKSDIPGLPEGNAFIDGTEVINPGKLKKLLSDSGICKDSSSSIASSCKPITEDEFKEFAKEHYPENVWRNLKGSLTSDGRMEYSLENEIASYIKITRKIHEQMKIGKNETLKQWESRMTPLIEEQKRAYVKLQASRVQQDYSYSKLSGKEFNVRNSLGNNNLVLLSNFMNKERQEAQKMGQKLNATSAFAGARNTPHKGNISRNASAFAVANHQIPRPPAPHGRENQIIPAINNPALKDPFLPESRPEIRGAATDTNNLWAQLGGIGAVGGVVLAVMAAKTFGNKWRSKAGGRRISRTSATRGAQRGANPPSIV